MNENTQSPVKQNNMALAVSALADEVNQLQVLAQEQYQSILQLSAENNQLKAELAGVQRRIPLVGTVGETCPEATENREAQNDKSCSAG